MEEKRSELDVLMEMLGEPKDGNLWIRVSGKKGDTILGYVKREPSWLVYEDENGDGKLTYADPCDSYVGKTAQFCYEYIQDE